MNKMVLTKASTPTGNMPNLMFAAALAPAGEASRYTSIIK
jgi:hypothetical protein